MEALFQDLRYALRTLLKNRAFTLAAVITLALGIGANTSIFSVMNAVLLRFLPVQNPQQLVYLQTDGMPRGAEETGNFAYTFNLATFEQLRTEHRVFSDLIAFVPLAAGSGTVPLRSGNDAEEATGDLVSGNFFSGLGVRAELGTLFGVEDEDSHTKKVVLSYNYWTKRFARDSSIIGRTVYVKSVPFTVIGVAAHNFIGVEYDGSSTDFWIPFQTDPKLNPRGSNSLYGSTRWWFLMMIGRLQPGMTWERAVALLNPEFQHSAYDGIGEPQAGERIPKIHFSATGGIEKLRESGTNPLTMLMTMVALVLVISCVNVGMLMAARNTVRRRDFCLRAALGADRRRIFSQLFAEALVLTVAASALAWSLSLWITPVVAKWAELDTPVTPDQSVFAFALAIAIVVTFVLALAPLPLAYRAQPGLLLNSGFSVGERRTRFRTSRLLLSCQIALCLVLLVGTSLLVRSLRNLQTTDLGFRASGLLVFGVTPPQNLHTPEDDASFYRSLIEQLRGLPGVESVTTMGNRIGSGWSNNTAVKVDGHFPPGARGVRWNDVGADFCRALGTPLLQGRDLRDSDSAGALINKTFADQYLPGTGAVGHQIQIASMKPYTVIGVVGDSKYTSVRESPVPTAYVPYTPSASSMNVALRVEGEHPMALLPAVHRVLAGFSPDIALQQPTTIEAQFEETYSYERLFARIALIFGLLAALLVAVGLYGTLAYKVGRRTAEIGLRMALGAHRAEVVSLVMRESLFISAIGLLAGLPLAWFAVRSLRAMLYQLSPFDPVSFVVAVCGIVLVTCAAAILPAVRAARVDPVVALRYE